MYIAEGHASLSQRVHVYVSSAFQAFLCLLICFLAASVESAAGQNKISFVSGTSLENGHGSQGQISACTFQGLALPRVVQAYDLPQ
jgi:hypothetical protein